MRGCYCYLVLDSACGQKDMVDCAEDLVDGGDRLIAVRTPVLPGGHC